MPKAVSKIIKKTEKIEEKQTVVKTMTVMNLGLELKRVIPFMSTKETRYYLNGIYFHHEGSEVVLVATDGHTLIESKMASGDTATLEYNFIMPDHICKLIARESGKGEYVSIELLENNSIRVKLHGSNLEFTTKTIDGTFPNYKRSIAPVIERGIGAKDFGINAHYLQRMVKAIGGQGKGVKVDITDNNNDPILFTADSGGGVRVVIMPMRV